MDKAVAESLLKNPEHLAILSRARRRLKSARVESGNVGRDIEAINKRLAALQEQIDTIAGALEKLAAMKPEAAKPAPAAEPVQEAKPKAKTKGVFPPED